MERIGRSASWLSTIFNATTRFIARYWQFRIRWRPQFDTYKGLQRYADAVGERGFGSNLIYSFVDGSFFESARPGYKQRRAYSGYYRGHSLKFQAIVTPDGIITLSLPFWANAHDRAIYEEDESSQRLVNLLDTKILEGEQALYLYGDNAYYGCSFVQAPFNHPNGHGYLSGPKQAFNGHLASARIAMENAFGDLTNRFTYNSAHFALFSEGQPIGSYYYTACFLGNILCCIREGNLVSSRYRCSPPLLEEYLDLQAMLQRWEEDQEAEDE